MATNTTNLGMDYAGTSAPLFSEIFTKVNNAKVKEEKIKVLKQHDSVPLRQILKGAFDPKIEWDLPEGIPPYKLMTHQLVQSIRFYILKQKDYGTL